MLHRLWILIVARRIPDLLVQVIQLLFMALACVRVLIVQAGRKVCILVQDLALMCEVFVDLLWVANDSLLVWILSQILEVLLLLL